MFVPIKESASLTEAHCSLWGATGEENPSEQRGISRNERLAYNERNGAKDFLDQLRCSRPGRRCSVTAMVGALRDHPDCSVELVGCLSQ